MPVYEEVSMIVSEPQTEAPAIFPQNLSVATTFDSHGEYYNNAASVNQTAVCGLASSTCPPQEKVAVIGRRDEAIGVQGGEDTNFAYTDCVAYTLVSIV